MLIDALKTNTLSVHVETIRVVCDGPNAERRLISVDHLAVPQNLCDGHVTVRLLLRRRSPQHWVLQLHRALRIRVSASRHNEMRPGHGCNSSLRLESDRKSVV